MQLSELLDSAMAIQKLGEEDPEVKGLTEDSREVKEGFLFTAVKGVSADGASYISDAVQNGARVVLAAPGQRIDEKGIVVLLADNPREALGRIAARFYSRQPDVIAAVTGTNGKTSVVHFCRQLWHHLGLQAASLGTLGIFTGQNNRFEETKGSMTTPGSVFLHETLSKLAAAGITRLALEASSHGIDQSRLAGVKIKIGAFTNFTHDHLDYHKTEEAYFAAKQHLFDRVMEQGGIAILNADIPEYKKLAHVAVSSGQKIISYGRNADDIKLISIDAMPDGQMAKVKIAGMEYDFKTSLVGDFQISNLLCSLGMMMAAGGDAKSILEIMPKVTPVPGRMELVGKKDGAAIFVDYAHTPNALELVLQALRPHVGKRGRLMVVFGCGGDRDKSKRQKMGKIAADLADKVIVTDDNPRSEEPAVIRKEILKAAKDAEDIGDRKEAIRKAIDYLKPGDLLVIAGKGHETGQIVGDKVLSFDDREIARKMLQSL